jgi:hypothetical protein
MKYTIHAEGRFQFIDEGKGETLLLLHGLFGALSNWMALSIIFLIAIGYLFHSCRFTSFPPVKLVWKHFWLFSKILFRSKN